jgi:environmental stress-induced protein Ves
MKIIRRGCFTAVPWKNGGGITHEALRVPGAAHAGAAHAGAGDRASADTFRWRVSVADITSSGPFSDFSGYHRALVLLRGAGVRLSFDGGDERVLRNAGDLVEFDGGLGTRSALLDGACSDLNLMVSTSLPRPRVRVESVTGPRELPGVPGTTLIFPIAGTLSLACDDDEPALLGEWDLAVVSAAQAGLLRPGTAAACLVFFATLEDNLA